MKPTHMIGGYAQLSWAPNYYGPTGSNRDSVTIVRKRSAEVDVLMRVKAQVAMVMNLDKCIGCHTCSVTCKQVWTNRPGHRVRVVQQRRDQARARAIRASWSDQARWNGGWELDRKGRLRLQGRRAGSRSC